MEHHRTYQDYVDEQFSKLKDHDHKLFEEVLSGLMAMRWALNGGRKTNTLLSRDDGATIKVFRSPECPEVIKIRLTAPPEEE